MSTMGITLSFIGLYVMQEMNGNLYQPNKYVAAHILKKFDFVTMKTASTPIETNKALLKDKEAEDVDVHLYRSMIGSLMYLTAFRPDISLVVCACASNYAGASLDRKSTIEVVNFLAKDETIIKEWEDRIDRAAITASSLEVECQDTILGGAEAQTRFKVASKQSNDPPLLRVNTLGSGEDNMKPKELMEFDLKFDDAEGTYCLPTATIFAELERMGAKNTSWNEFSSTMASDIICLAKNKNFNFSKKAKRPTEISQSSGPIPFEADETVINEWEDRMERDATTASSLEAEELILAVVPGAKIPYWGVQKLKLEIATLKDRVKKLEKKRRSRTYKPRRLYKVGLSRRIKSTDDASLGAQEDASKQGRKIVDLDADIEVTLIDETQGRNDEDLMFDAGVLNSDEVFQEPIVNTDTTTKSSIPVSAADPVTTTGEVVTTASVEIPEELTLAQTLIEIKSAKPKAVTTTTVKLASSRPKAKGIVFHDQEEQASASTPIVSPLQLPQAKDKGKAKMVEPEKPLKKKDQIAIDEEVARNLEAQLQAELEEEERLSRQKEEEANIALIESWDNTQAMMDADFQLAQQMQTEEQEQLSIEEKSKFNIRRASKGYTGVDIPLFPTMLVQGAPTTSQPPLSSPSRIPTRQETEVPQPSSLTYTNVADEVAFTRVDVIHEGAATTISSIDVGQGSGNIPKSSTMPHDSPLPGGHTLGSDEGSMTLHELTVLCIKLSNKVDSLETELKQTKQTYGAALTKLIKKVKKLEQTVKTSQARKRAKIVSSQEDQSEDQLGVLSAAKVLADVAKKNVNTYTRRRITVSTGSEEVSTTSRIFSTAEESVSTAGVSMPVSTVELAQKLHEEEQARFNEKQEAKFNAEQEELLASETNEDEANPTVADIHWDDVQAQI
ncbi:hypothetical protein Tco_0041150 [Tanacetum coccineum]